MILLISVEYVVMLRLPFLILVICVFSLIQVRLPRDLPTTDLRKLALASLILCCFLFSILLIYTLIFVISFLLFTLDLISSELLKVESEAISLRPFLFMVCAFCTTRVNFPVKSPLVASHRFCCVFIFTQFKIQISLLISSLSLGLLNFQIFGGDDTSRGISDCGPEHLFYMT